MTDAMDLETFDWYFQQNNRAALEKYASAWPRVEGHYPIGWCFPFFAPNRFLSRVIFSKLFMSSGTDAILDFGCYDGLLIRAFLDQGREAFGYESFPCMPAFEALGIADRINVRHYCPIVIAFGMAQEYSFENLLAKIEEENAGLPDVLYFDRELTRRTIHNKTYFDTNFLLSQGITVVKFPNCVSEHSQADMLIWRKSAAD